MATTVVVELVAAVVIVAVVLMIGEAEVAQGARWCVARSEASDQALQTALDYACGTGADCSPILSSGLCYLPNTLQAHASYAFNSYFQRKAMAPGSCDFSGTATIAMTDPSYGSCVYPASASAAGGEEGDYTSHTNTDRTHYIPEYSDDTNYYYTTVWNGGGGGLNPGMGPSIPNTDNTSKASLESYITTLLPFSSLLVLLVVLHSM